MNNKEKYYKPSIEEFNIGFEYEKEEYQYYDLNICNTYWEKEIFDIDDRLENTLEDLLFNKIRVKYLDREDIESLGWKQLFDSREHGEYKKELKNNRRCHIRVNEKFIWIGLGTNGLDFERYDTVFKGTIKNKSELKVLLKQLGI